MKTLHQGGFQLLVLAALIFSACQGSKELDEENTVKPAAPLRIISLSGTITEILFELNLGDSIVGIDVTSTYPERTNSITKLGHISSVKAEGLITLNPTHVVIEKGTLSIDLTDMLKSANVTIVEFDREISVEGTKQLITTIAKTFDRSIPENLFTGIDSPLNRLSPYAIQPTVLFIYGRSAGNLMVAGEGTSMDKIIALSGAKNAVSGFNDFKPLSNEVLIEANPDFILLFESAESALNGIEGILEIPGLAQTKAGKERRFIFMDGQFVSGFGPRLGQAVFELNQAYNVTRE
jgi:iron complex transport system substrate-binding protein